MPDPNYFSDDPAHPERAALHRLLVEMKEIRNEQRAAAADLEKAIAESGRRAEEIAGRSSEVVRGELIEAVRRIQAEMVEVRRATGTLEGGIGESRAALVELVEYDRQRRRREEADRERADREQRAAKAAELNRVARAHLRAGRKDEAIAALTEARGLDGENAEVLSNLGAALLSADRIPAAEDPLRRAARMADDFAPARANLGALLLLKGDAEEAQKHLEAAVKLDPTLGGAWNSLGNARWRLGRYAAAIEAWHQGWRADPLCHEVARNLQRQQEIE